jgi:hypothetical protein
MERRVGRRAGEGGAEGGEEGGGGWRLRDDVEAMPRAVAGEGLGGVAEGVPRQRVESDREARCHDARTRLRGGRQARIRGKRLKRPTRGSKDSWPEARKTRGQSTWLEHVARARGQSTHAQGCACSGVGMGGWSVRSVGSGALRNSMQLMMHMMQQAISIPSQLPRAERRAIAAIKQTEIQRARARASQPITTHVSTPSAATRRTPPAAPLRPHPSRPSPPAAALPPQPSRRSPPAALRGRDDGTG